MSDHPHVELGVLPNGEVPNRLPVYPQTWPRIVKKLGRLYDKVRASGASIDGENLDAGALVASLGDYTYEALTIFIPNLPERMPEWKFAGYGSPDAAAAGDYDERLDQAPTFPQIIAAFETCFAVNGGKRFLDMLGGVFDPKLLKAEMSLALSEWRESQSIGSPSLPSTNSGSDQPTSSGTTDQTSAAPATEAESVSASPTLTSSGSPQPISA